MYSYTAKHFFLHSFPILNMYLEVVGFLVYQCFNSSSIYYKLHGATKTLVLATLHSFHYFVSVTLYPSMVPLDLWTRESMERIIAWSSDALGNMTVYKMRNTVCSYIAKHFYLHWSFPILNLCLEVVGILFFQCFVSSIYHKLHGSNKALFLETLLGFHYFF